MSDDDERFPAGLAHFSDIHGIHYRGVVRMSDSGPRDEGI